MKSIANDEVNVLRQNARAVVRELGLLNDAYFNIGVTLAERHLLIELNSCLCPTVGEIAERLLLDKSTASRLIAKAVRKGYVNYSSDEVDKRKRFLQLTEKGRKTLNAFEPIAFNQTKEALLTLTEEEIKTVYRGIALYAKGLKHSRLRNRLIIQRMTSQDYVGLSQVVAALQKEAYFIGWQHTTDWARLFDTYQKKGFSYFVMKIETRVIGGAGVCPYHESSTCELANLCIQSDMGGVGFEKILIDFCMKEAKRLGYAKCIVDAEKAFGISSQVFQEQGFQWINKNKKQTSLLWKAC